MCPVPQLAWARVLYAFLGNLGGVSGGFLQRPRSPANPSSRAGMCLANKGWPGGLRSRISPRASKSLISNLLCWHIAVVGDPPRHGSHHPRPGGNLPRGSRRGSAEVGRGPRCLGWPSASRSVRAGVAMAVGSGAARVREGGAGRVLGGRRIDRHNDERVEAVAAGAGARSQRPSASPGAVGLACQGA